MKLNKSWNNWRVFFVAVALSIIATIFAEPHYRNIFHTYSGNLLFPVEVNTYPSTFFLLYTLFISFFYKAFSKNFKPLTLVYFLALSFLLFASSLPHLAAFAILLVAGLIFGKIVSKAIHV